MQKPPAPARTAGLKSDRAPIDVLIDPFTRFSGMEASGGILLLAATVIALVWANSPWEHGYHAIWEREVTAGLGRTVLTWSRHLWVNDGLMSVFFFLVGLEIKRDLLIGELSSGTAPRRTPGPCEDWNVRRLRSRGVRGMRSPHEVFAALRTTNLTWNFRVLRGGGRRDFPCAWRVWLRRWGGRR
jgi:hypothetical protein